MNAILLPFCPNHRRLPKTFAAVLLVLLLTASLWSQSAPAQPQTPPPVQQPTQPSQAAPPAQPASPNQPAAPSEPGAQESQAGSDQGQSSEPPESQTRITKQQAKELFRSVDEILQFASEDTGLPIEHKVKRNLITRESVEKYVDKRMKDDKDAKRLEQSRLVLQKFGLIPQGYDLHGELLRLMAEQVAAYYDPKTQSVNLLDWVQPDVQKPILSHELTHALQDQKVGGLDMWELAGAKDDAALPDKEEYTAEEAQSARQCVTEGEAMVVLFDYSLAPYGKNILTAPDAVAAMRAGMADNRDSPIFAAAPMFLKESLLMPYTFGLDFVRTVLAKVGKQGYAMMLENPPIDTRQIMQPETYLLHQQVAEPMIPDLDRLVAPNYERFDFGSMGEFDVYLLAKQYGAKDPENYYPHWRGGYYFAAHQKTAPKDQIAMLYYSKWDSPESAQLFARLYAEYLPKRYKKAVLEPAKSGEGDKRNVWVFDTDEGKAVLEIHDSDLLITESFDDAVREKARQVYFFGMALPAAPAKTKS